MYPADVGHGRPDGDAPDELAPEVEADGERVTSGRCGYVQSVRDDNLMDAARRGDVLIALRVRPGQYVLDDTVVALVHPPDRADEKLCDAIRSALQVADARSPHQDPEFAVQQLTEMAVRALSPGTNDPYTAVNALDDLSAGLARLVSRTPPRLPAWTRTARCGCTRRASPSASSSGPCSTACGGTRARRRRSCTPRSG